MVPRLSKHVRLATTSPVSMLERIDSPFFSPSGVVSTYFGICSVLLATFVAFVDAATATAFCSFAFFSASFLTFSAFSRSFSAVKREFVSTSQRGKNREGLASPFRSAFAAGTAGPSAGFVSSDGAILWWEMGSVDFQDTSLVDSGGQK